MNDDFYKPAQIALVTGCSERTVYRYLLERFPDHVIDAWWRLSEDQYALAVNELHTARMAFPTQPRRALHQPQKMLLLG